MISRSLSILLLAIALPAQSGIVDRVAAVVDKQVITVSEVNQMVELHFFPRNAGESEDDYRHRILEALIAQALRFRDVERFGAEDVPKDSIESRVQEILSLIRSEIRHAGYERRLPAGVVLVGGTAEVRDIRHLGRDIMEMPVRVGIPGRAIGLTDTIMRPAYATTIGLLLWAAYHTESDHVSATALPEWKGLSSLKGWFREFLT